MKYIKYSHSGGDQAVQPSMAAGVESAIKMTDCALTKGTAAAVRHDLLTRLRDGAGWSDPVRISASRGVTLTARKGKTGLCLQTGNMARFYADLLKLQAQYLDGKITSAIYVLPARVAAVAMGDNLANFERLTAELEKMFTKVVSVPMLVYGFYSDSTGG